MKEKNRENMAPEIQTLLGTLQLLSDIGEICWTSANWSFRQQDLEEKDDPMNE